MNLLSAFAAPFIGVDPKRPGVLHAITMEEYIRAFPFPPRRAFWAVGACGAKHLKIAGNEERGGGLWPPFVKGMPEGKTRCRECHVATGRMRPRSAWKARTP